MEFRKWVYCGRRKKRLDCGGDHVSFMDFSSLSWLFIPLGVTAFSLPYIHVFIYCPQVNLYTTFSMNFFHERLLLGLAAVLSSLYFPGKIEDL